MPTLEIVSFDAIGLNIEKNNFEFYIVEENELKSHRGLFYDYLMEQKGVILHLGNPDQKSDDYFCWADELIDWKFSCDEIQIPNINDSKHGSNQEKLFQFNERYKNDIIFLLNTAIGNSQTGRAGILTDYQFGPENGQIINIKSVNDFWNEHNKNGLILNTLYEFYGK
jgi:hypothetical protein